MEYTLYLDGELVAFTEGGDELIEGEEHSEEVAHEEAGDPPNPVLPVANELIYAAVFFALLWALMRYVLLPPIQKGRAEREDKLRADRDAADTAVASVGQTERDYEEALVEARAQANTIVEGARAEADAHRQQLQGAADAELATLRSNAAAEIATTREQALRSMQGDVAALATQAASIVISKQLDVAAQQATIDQALNGAS